MDTFDHRVIVEHKMQLWRPRQEKTYFIIDPDGIFTLVQYSLEYHATKLLNAVTHHPISDLIRYGYTVCKLTRLNPILSKSNQYAFDILMPLGVAVIEHGYPKRVLFILMQLLETKLVTTLRWNLVILRIGPQLKKLVKESGLNIKFLRLALEALPIRRREGMP